MHAISDLLRGAGVQRRCQAHGEYLAFNRQVAGRHVETLCPRCEEARQKKASAVDAQQAREQRRQTHLETAFQRAGIPPRFADRRFESYRIHCDGQRNAVRLCRAYADRFTRSVMRKGTNLVLCGGVGTGKTHLACAIANAVIPQGHTVLFLGVAAAVRRIKDTWGAGSSTSEQQAIFSFLEPDLLILDELGVQFGSETERMLLFEIINSRYEHLKPTIVISNLERDELAAYMGVRVMDRMQEAGGAIVALNWESYRARTGKLQGLHDTDQTTRESDRR